ncbi:peptidase [Streptomyces californicus]|uniref:peptidase n=1 Tax=Streptomyces californicus TaxID=67351 RepID=UPI00378B6CD5
MPPPPSARLRDVRTVAALGLAAGITVPAALLSGPQAAARPGAPALSDPAAGSVTAAATVAAGVSPLAADAVEEQPGCGDPDAKEFPVAVRFQDAPDRYPAGGGHRSWLLDLTNTTDATCRALHPVLVLTDRDRRLTAEQIRAEFSEPGRTGTVHRVAWETTDRDEQIGVFGGEEVPNGSEEEGRGGPGEPFLGFTVPAGETVSVRVRMAFTSDAAPGPVTAHVAVVQRRHQDKAKGGGREDGEWVGDSGEYPFVIADGTTGGTREPEAPRAEHPPRPDAPARRSGQPESPAPQRSGRPDHAESPAPDRSGLGADPRTDPGTGAGTDPGIGPADPGSGRPPTSDPAAPSPDPALPPDPGLPPRDGPGRPLPELARTGLASAAWTGVAAGALLLGGTGLLRYARRVRRAHRTAD